MFAGKYRKNAILGLLSSTIALSSFLAAAALSPLPGSTSYNAIGVDEVKAQAKIDLANAYAANRLSTEEKDKYLSALDSAYSLSGAEQIWAELSGKIQEARAKHLSIDHLVTTFTNKLDNMQRKGTILPSAAVPYKERLKAIYRLKKQFYNNDHFYDFWEFLVLAIDLSSIDDKLERALTKHGITIEQLNDLILRSDNYVASNQVCARGLTTFKSFEIDPDHLQQVRNELYSVLKDKAHSKLSTPEVKTQLYKRLLATHYESCSTLPTEADLDKAIAEVGRLLDSGARNGNLGAADALRLSHELQMIKELKNAFPGPHPGVDLVERELRKEEIRFMSQDLRFMQDWLGRVLRKDGDLYEGREQTLRLVRRLDLARFTHRLTDAQANTILADLNEALKDDTNDNNLAEKVKALQGKLDMMISDYSMAPAENNSRLSELSSQINRLKIDQSTASADKDRIQRLLANPGDTPAMKYGTSVVAAYELEMVRKKVLALLKFQGLTDASVIIEKAKS